MVFDNIIKEFYKGIDTIKSIHYYYKTRVVERLPTNNNSQL